MIKSYFINVRSTLIVAMSLLLVACGGGDSDFLDGEGGNDRDAETIVSIQLKTEHSTIASGTSTNISVVGVLKDQSVVTIDGGDVTWSIDEGEGATLKSGVLEASLPNQSIVVSADYHGKSASVVIQTTDAALSHIVVFDKRTDKPLTPSVMPLGTSFELYSVGYFTNNTTQTLQNVTYLTSNANAISIVGDTVHASKTNVEESLISAEFEHAGNKVVSNEVALNTTSAAVEKIELLPSFSASEKLYVGFEYNIDVQATLTNGTTANITSLVEWSSNNERVAKITDNVRGALSALGSGEAEISAEYSGKTASLKVDVKELALSKLEIIPSINTIAIGETFQYIARAHYDTDKFIDVTEQVIWSSSLPGIAEVDSDTGHVEAKAVGRAQIIAKLGDSVISTELHVVNKIATSINISIDDSQVSLSNRLPEGQYVKLKAIVTYNDNSVNENMEKSVTWSSSNPVSVIVSDGELYALKNGVSKLQASYQNTISNEIEFTVDAAVIDSVWLKEVDEVAAGEPKQFELLGKYTNGLSLDLTEFASWSVTALDGSATTLAHLTTTKGEVATSAKGTVKVTAVVPENVTGNTSLSATAELTISDKKITDVVINGKQAIVINKGLYVDPEIKVHYSNGDEEVVDASTSGLTFYTSTDGSNTAAFNVNNLDSEKGRLTAKNEGVTKAWAVYKVQNVDYKSDEVDVFVSGKVADRLRFTQFIDSIPKGSHEQFLLEVVYSDGSSADVTSSATWQVDAPDLASINKGRVSTNLTNTGDFVVTASYGGLTHHRNVAVSTATLVSIELSNTSKQVHKGVTADFVLTAKYSDNTSSIQTDNALWSSSAPTFVSVDKGNVKGLDKGEATITATLGGESVTAKVFVVEEKVNSVDIELGTNSISKGTTTDITLWANYEGSTDKVDVTAQAGWELDTDVAYITQGTIYGHNKGDTAIKASFGGETATVSSFEVTDKALRALVLTPEPLELANGATETLTLTAEFTDNSSEVITNTNAVWSVVTGSSVSVDSAGMVTALAKSSSATVKAIYNGFEATLDITTKDAEFVGIALADKDTRDLVSNKVVSKGSDYEVVVLGLYSDSSSQVLSSNLEFFSDNENVAEFNAGTVDAKEVGQANLTAKYTFAGETWNTTKLTVNVIGADVDRLEITAPFSSSANIIAGIRYDLNVIAHLTDGNEANVTSLVDWDSDAENIAEITDATRGYLLAKSDGEAEITASYAGEEAALTVNVVEPSLDDLVISPSGAIVNVDGKQQYSAIAYYNNDSSVDVTAIVGNWQVSDTSFAQIDKESGELLALSPGKTQVSAEFGGLVRSVLLEVTDKPVTSIQAAADKSEIPQGRSVQLSATVNYQDGQDTNMQNSVYWELDKPELGYVKEGVFYATHAGEVELSATFRGESSNTFTIKIEDAVIERIELEFDRSSVAAGEHQQYRLAGIYSDQSKHYVNDLATWSVTESDGSATTLASMSTTKGEVLTGENSGDVLVTAVIPASISNSTELTSSATLTISDREVTHIVLNGQQPFVINKGQTVLPRVDVHYTSGAPEVLSTDDSDLSFHTKAGQNIAAFNINNIDTEKGELKAENEGLTEAWAIYNVGGKAFISDEVDVAVTGKVVSGLTFESPKASLPKGVSQEYIVKATYSDGSTEDVSRSAEWQVDLANIATIDKGVVTTSTSNSGDVVLTAKYGGESQSVTIEVTGEQLVDIELSQNSAQVHKGLDVTFKLWAIYSDGSRIDQAASASAVWSSAESSVASVDKGTIVGVAEGKTEVSVSFGGFDAEADIYVLSESIDHLAITLTTTSLHKGLTAPISAQAYYENDPSVSVDVTKLVHWEADHDKVYITEGTVYGYGEGTTDITATLAGAEAKVNNFTVTSKIVDYIEVTAPSSTLAIGTEQQLKVTAFYTDNSRDEIDASSSDVTWSIDSSSVADAAEVSQGLVKAKEANANVEVKAVYQGKEATTSITTTSAVLTSIVLMDSINDQPLTSMMLPVGMVQPISVKGVFSAGNPQALTTGLTYKGAQAGVAVYATDVSGNRTISAAGEGQVVLSVEYTDSATGDTFVSQEVIVHVVDATIIDLDIIPVDFNASDNLITNMTNHLKAEATLTNGDRIDVTSVVRWESDAPAVAQISATTKGGIDTLTAGEANITASYKDSDASLKVNVVNTQLTSIEVLPENPTIHVNGTQPFEAWGHYDNGQRVDITSQVTWSIKRAGTTPPIYATIDNAGLATANAVAVGEATVEEIDATFNSITGSTSLTITADKEVDSISFTILQGGSISVGDSRSLSVQLTYKDGSFDYDAATKVHYIITPTSPGSNPNIVSIHDGKIYGLSPGNVKVEAAYGGLISGEQHIRVNSTLSLHDHETGDPIDLTKEVEIAEGHSLQLNAHAGHSSFHTIIDNANVEWKSEDDDKISVVDGLITALIGKGSVGETLEITAEIGGAKLTFEVKVVAAKVVGVEFNYPMPIVVSHGDIVALDAQVLMSNGSHQAVDFKNLGHITFTTSDSSIVDIDSSDSDYLKANGTGYGFISLTYNDGTNVHVSDEVLVLVQGASVNSLNIVNAPSELPEGSKHRLNDLQVIATYSNGDNVDVTSMVSWDLDSTYDTLAEIVDGEVIAKSAGDVEIVASFDGKPKTWELEITSETLDTETLWIEPNLLTLNPGDKQAVSIKGKGTTGSSTITLSGVTWTVGTGDDSIIKMDGDTVEAMGPGQTTLTGTTDDGKELTATVNVSDAEVVGIAISDLSITLPQGAEKRLSALAIYNYGAPQTITSGVTWSVSDASVSVDSTTGVLTGVSQNQGNQTPTTVHAEWTEGSNTYTAEREVVVTQASISELKIVTGDIELRKNDSTSISAIAVYNNGDMVDVSQQVEWTLDDDSFTSIVKNASLNVVTISSSTTADSTTLKAKLSTGEESESVNVKVVVLTAIDVQPAISGLGRIAKGTGAQLIAYGQFDNRTEWVELSEGLEWTSSDDAYLSVDANGFVTGEDVYPGQTITVTDTRSGLNKDYTIAITDAEPESIFIALASNPDAPIGAGTTIDALDTLSLIARYNMTDDSVQTASTNLTWSSSNDAKLTVSAAGVLTGVEESASVTISVDTSLSSNHWETDGNRASATVQVLRSINVVTAESSLPEGDFSEAYRKTVLRFTVDGTITQDANQILSELSVTNLDNRYSARIEHVSGKTFDLSLNMSPSRLGDIQYVVNIDNGSSLHGLIRAEQSLIQWDGLTLTVNGDPYPIPTGNAAPTVIDGVELTRATQSVIRGAYGREIWGYASLTFRHHDSNNAISRIEPTRRQITQSNCDDLSNIILILEMNLHRPSWGGELSPLNGYDACTIRTANTYDWASVQGTNIAPGTNARGDYYIVLWRPWNPGTYSNSYPTEQFSYTNVSDQTTSRMVPWY